MPSPAVRGPRPTTATKRIFLSDIHLSSKKLYDDPHGPTWYRPEVHGPRLLRFLNEIVLGSKDQIKDVILLGDVFNTWLCSAHATPPTYGQIFSANKEVLSKLKELIKAGISLFYIKGNHDFDLPPAAIRKAVPGIQVVRSYRSGRMHAEHGHRFDLFNRPDYVTDPGHGRPIGYFITRLVASVEDTGFGILDLPTYLDDVLEAAITSQNLYSSIIEGLAERAGMRGEDEIAMPGPGKQVVTIDELKDRYQVLDELYGRRELISNLYERRYLNGSADQICHRSEVNVVVFGHTHKAMIDKDFFLVDDRIYANTGSWCKEKAHWVVIDKPPGAPTTVCLHGIDKKGKMIAPREEQL